VSENSDAIGGLWKDLSEREILSREREPGQPTEDLAVQHAVEIVFLDVPNIALNYAIGVGLGQPPTLDEMIAYQRERQRARDRNILVRIAQTWDAMANFQKVGLWKRAIGAGQLALDTGQGIAELSDMESDRYVTDEQPALPPTHSIQVGKMRDYIARYAWSPDGLTPQQQEALNSSKNKSNGSGGTSPSCIPEEQYRAAFQRRKGESKRAADARMEDRIAMLKQRGVICP
jgi:hypothetical protein